MERAEKVGLGVALVGHAVLFGLLSVGFLSTPNPMKLKQTPIDVSLVDAVAVEAEAPVIQTEAPAQSKAPEEGPAEAAAPPESAPEPVPAPEPEPAPPVPASPRPVPPKPATRPAPKPAPAPKPVPQPVPKPRPQPAAAAEPTRAKPTPPRSVPAAKPRVAARPAAQPKAAAATPARGTGSSATGTARRPTGRLDNLFQAGVGTAPTPSKAETPRATRIGAQAAANIGSAIQRQVQPCADRQVSPGPGAERIRVNINLRMNRDGSLVGRPTIKGHSGVDVDNERYVGRVDDLAIATFIGCSPLKGLPPELYDIPGGWSNFTLRYKLLG